MSELLARLRGGATLLADGAMGTLLIARGLPPGEPPESFNLEHPDLLAEIAHLYREAGADIVHTNTFGGSPLKLAMYGLEDQAAEINRRAVAAARQGAGAQAIVSGSVGPSGCTLQPYGDAEPDALYASFRAQIAALLDAGVDAVTIETMTDLNEASLAIRASRDLSGTLPILATMTFDETPRGFYTIMGTSVADAVSGLGAAGADAVGSNCGNGIAKMVAIAREMREIAEQPLIIQSNAGLPEIEGERTVYRETPDLMAAQAQELLELGVSIIGGCCGTTPDHIRALRRIIDTMAR
ncbi:MAG: hypothetical protein GF330_09755 [Candidatus Eisenbacteria bacterium]|nr:hypothetical protein [Candidatus Eisenbacteria bacterium]